MRTLLRRLRIRSRRRRRSRRRYRLPILEWLPRYRREWLRGDLAAGLSVGILLIPQGMAYAMIAGLDPVYGLYAALVPQVVYAVLGTSRQLAVGPVAMDSLLVAAALGTLGLAGADEYAVAAVFMALIVGALQIGMGALRLGFLVNFLSRPVVSGFTSAAAIIIALSQLKHLLGIATPNVSRLAQIARETLSRLAETNPYALGLGLATVGIVVLVRRYGRGLPSALVAVVLGTLVVFFTGWSELGVPIVGEVPGGLPGFAVPGLDSGLLRPLLPLAFTIALIGYAESISIARSLQDQYGGSQLDPTKELIALGSANALGSLFSGYVSTASFSRSAIAGEAGAKTGVAALVSAAVIALTLLFLTPLFYYLPNAVLGAVILVAVVRLVDFAYAAQLWNESRFEAVILSVTFLVTLNVGMVEGIGAGVFLSLAYTVYRASAPHIAEVARVGGTDYFRNVERFPDAVEIRPEVLMFRFDAPVFFGNVAYFKDELAERIERRGAALETVVINCEAITYIDSTGSHALAKLIAELQARGLRVIVSGAIGPARDVILRGPIGALVGERHMFVRSSEVMDFLDGVAEPSAMQRRIARQGFTPEEWRALHHRDQRD